MSAREQRGASRTRRRPAPRCAGRRRVRLARGPVTIGEPAPAVEVRLGAGEPYRPDTIADGGTAFGLTVRAASVRGLSKRYAGGPRQDDICLRLHGPTRTLIAALADGVSGAARSDLGAALAVRYAAAAVARQLDVGEADSLDWANVFDQAAWALVEEHRRSGGDSAVGVDEAARSLATTLLVAAVVVREGRRACRSRPSATRRASCCAGGTTMRSWAHRKVATD
jgi:Protein phosphatase 2C